MTAARVYACTMSGPSGIGARPSLVQPFQRPEQPRGTPGPADAAPDRGPSMTPAPTAMEPPENLATPQPQTPELASPGTRAPATPAQRAAVFLDRVIAPGFSDHLRAVGWADSDIVDLSRAVMSVHRSMTRYYANNPKLVGNGNGTLANVWGTITLDLSRGCLAHQEEVIIAARGSLPNTELEIQRVAIGNGLEHHAVVVFPAGTDWQQTGMVLDPWIQQSADLQDFAMPIGEWLPRFRGTQILGRPRLEADP